jgi:hypothetical protein
MSASYNDNAQHNTVVQSFKRDEYRIDDTLDRIHEAKQKMDWIQLAVLYDQLGEELFPYMNEEEKQTIPFATMELLKEANKLISNEKNDFLILRKDIDNALGAIKLRAQKEGKL